MDMFKDHLKLTCKIIIDDIYENYWSYMKKYNGNKKKELEKFVKSKYSS
jgi:hypothetical protein